MRCETCDALFTPNGKGGTQQKYCSQSCACAHPARRKSRQEKSAARRKKLDDIKVGMGCKACGYNSHPRALDFNHRDPSTKLFHVGREIGRRWDSILAEISKCDILCANCHRIHTHINQHCIIRK